MKFSAIILAGGEARRLGTFKPLVKLAGEPLICYVINCLKEIASQLVIVVKCEEQKRLIQRELEATIKVDFTLDDGNYGLLSAIKAGIKASSNQALFITGCDLPLISREVVLKLISRILKSDFEAIVPKWKNNYIEPLYAAYKKNALMKALLDLKKLKNKSLRELLGCLKTHYISAEELEKLAKCPTFLNINTPEDLRRAEKYIEKYWKSR